MNGIHKSANNNKQLATDGNNNKDGNIQEFSVILKPRLWSAANRQYGSAE